MKNSELIFPERFSNRILPIRVVNVEKEKFKKGLYFESMMGTDLEMEEEPVVLLVLIFAVFFIGLSLLSLFLPKNIAMIFLGVIIFLLLTVIVVGIFYFVTLILFGKPKFKIKEKTLVKKRKIKIIKNHNMKLVKKEYYDIQSDYIRHNDNHAIWNGYTYEHVINKEFMLDICYGSTNNIKTNKKYNHFYNEMDTLTVNWLSINAIKGIMNHLLENNIVHERYLFWLEFHKYLTKNMLFQRIEYLTHNRDLINPTEFEIMKNDLITNIEKKTFNLLEKLENDDKEKLKKKYQLYYKELVNK